MSTLGTIRIGLFGCLSISTSRSSAQLAPSRASAVFAWLALDPRKTHVREELVDRFWPEDDIEGGRRKLRQCLHELRRDLESIGLNLEEIAEVGRASIKLRCDRVEVDASEFEAQISVAKRACSAADRCSALSRACQLYADEALPGYYQECIIQERVRLASVYQSALWDLAHAYEQLGRDDEAVGAIRRLIAVHALNTEGHLVLMRLYARAGQVSLVRRQFSQLQAVLKDQLGAEADAATCRTAERLVAEAAANAAAHAARPQGADRRPLEEPVIEDDVFTAPHPEHLPARRPPGRRSVAAGLVRPGLVAALLFIAGAWLLHAPRGRRPMRTLIVPAPEVGDNSIGILCSYPLAADERSSEPHAMAVDPSGNLYVTGLVETAKTDADGITVKFSPEGKLLWRDRYDGPSHDVDRMIDIAVDASGCAYVTGESDNGGGNQTTRLCGLDFVTIKYSPAGERIWCRRYDDIYHGEDRPVRILVDKSGSVYVLGRCRRLRNGKDAGWDIVLVKYSAGGSLAWVERCDDGEDNVPANMCLDRNGNICVCGASRRMYCSGREYDFVTLKYQPNGRKLWEMRYGEGNLADDYARAISSDYDGNTYVIGNGRGKAGTPDADRNGCILVKYGPDGSELLARGTTSERFRLARVTACSFFADGASVVSGPAVTAGGADVFRTVFRGADGSETGGWDDPASECTMAHAPIAVLIDTGSPDGDSCEIVTGLLGKYGHAAFTVTVGHNRLGNKLTRSFGMSQGDCLCRAAVRHLVPAGGWRTYVASMVPTQTGTGTITITKCPYK